MFAFVGDEESGEPGSGISAGARHLVQDISRGAISKPDFAIYVEPTMLDLYPAHMGFIIVALKIIGRTAYFGVPERDIDALKAPHAILRDIWAYGAALAERAEHSRCSRRRRSRRSHRLSRARHRIR
jgi:hypothetical protein